MAPDRSLLDLVALSQDLEELLQRKVDVLTDASLHPALRQSIIAEARPLEGGNDYLGHIRDAISDIETYAS